MTNTRIVPEKITTPLQLLATWLAGLVLLDGSFLTAATLIHNPSWLSIILVLAAILNVPIFIYCLFTLQTKYRTEMQEDSYYAEHLRLKYAEPIIPPVDIEKRLHDLTEEITTIAKNTTEHDSNKVEEQIAKALNDYEYKTMKWRFRNSFILKTIYEQPELWQANARKWLLEDNFFKDFDGLYEAGLLIIPGDKVENIPVSELTPIGKEVARALFDKKSD